MTSWIDKLKQKIDPEPPSSPDNRLMEYKSGWVFDQTKVIYSELVQENPKWGGDYSHYRYPGIGSKFWHCEALGRDIHEDAIFSRKEDAVKFAKEQINAKINLLQKAIEAL